MAESRTQEEPRSWRRRHPLAGRLVIYAALLGVVLVAASIYVDGRNQRLRARLHSLDVVAAIDADGSGIRRILEEEFEVPLLPAELRRDVQRAWAFAKAKGGDTDGARAALTAADALNDDPVVAQAIRIERSQLLMYAGDAAAALTALGDESWPEATPSIALWWALARASALVASTRGEEGVRGIRTALQACPRPLSSTDVLWLGGTPWRPREVAQLAVQSLQGLGGATPEDWERLLELSPEDFACAVQVAHALLELGESERAARAWALAETLDPVRAAEVAAEDAKLGALRKALKPASARGR